MLALRMKTFPKKLQFSPISRPITDHIHGLTLILGKFLIGCKLLSSPFRTGMETAFLTSDGRTARRRRGEFGPERSPITT